MNYADIVCFMLIYGSGNTTIELNKYSMILECNLLLDKHISELNVNFLFSLKKVYYKKEKSDMKSDDEFVNIEVTNSRINHINSELKKSLKK